jgi:hypothetical protein
MLDTPTGTLLLTAMDIVGPLLELSGFLGDEVDQAAW